MAFICNHPLFDGDSLCVACLQEERDRLKADLIVSQNSTDAAHDAWLRARSEVERLKAALPWEGARIKFLTCPAGHGRLIASNWPDLGCFVCARNKERARAERAEAMVAAKDMHVHMLDLVESADDAARKAERELAAMRLRAETAEAEVTRLSRALMEAAPPIPSIWGYFEPEKPETSFTYEAFLAKPGEADKKWHYIALSTKKKGEKRGTKRTPGPGEKVYEIGGFFDTAIRVVLPTPPPCLLCDEPVLYESGGGPLICPACDIGDNPKRLTPEQVQAKVQRYIEEP